tara:strand:+ start:446 stop:721 length:276 start_codon:yes stop_codon:yes gene_type:complete
MKISKAKAIDLIKTNGLKQTVGVTHIKKEDGSLRTGSYKLGVKKNLTGKGLKYNPEDYNLIPVYDMNKDYRMIWADGIQKVTVDGTTYEVE